MKSAETDPGMPLFAAVNRAGACSYTEQVVLAVRAAIADGRLGAGAVLPSRIRLAAVFGVSENVIRAAMSRLKAMNLVVSRPRIGSIVVPPARAEVRFRDVLYVTTELSGAYSNAIFRDVVQMGLLREGFRLFPVSVPIGASRRHDIEVLKAALRENFSLIIVETCLFACRGPMKVIRESGVPFIVLGQTGLSDSNCLASFGYDASTAVQAFVKDSVRRGILSCEVVTFTSSGFVETARQLAEAGINVERLEIDMHGVFSDLGAIQAEAARIMNGRLQRGMLPDMFYFSDDYIARGAIPVLLKHGIDGSGRVRLASHSNRGFPPSVTATLALIEFDPRSAAAHLVDSIRGYFRTGRFEHVHFRDFTYHPGP